MTDETGSAQAPAGLGAGNLDHDPIGGDGGGEIAFAHETPPPAPHGGDWTHGLAEDQREFAQTKGWRSPGDMLASYRSLEGLLGGEKLPLPKDEADREGYERLYKALGRPDAPEGYGIKAPKGADGAFAGEAAKWFHEAGLSAKQGQALAEKWNAYAGAAAEAEDRAFQLRSGQEMGELKTEWGDRYGSNVELARRAASQFGLQPGEIGRLERALGSRRMVETLYRIGAGLGEHSFEAGEGRGGSGGFRLSPEAARARIAMLKSDKAWMARYLGGDAEAKSNMNRLQQAAYPDMS